MGLAVSRTAGVLAWRLWTAVRVFVSVKATARSLEAATGALRLPGPLDALGLQEKTVSG